MKWHLKFIIIPAIFTVFSVAVSSHAVAGPKNTLAYEVLGIPIEEAETITADQVEQAFDVAIRKPGLSDEQKAEMLGAKSLLSNDELRSAYNKNEPLEMTVPPEERERLAEMMKATNPQAASRLVRTGKVLAEEIGGAANFYAVIGATKTVECFNKSDTDICKSFFASLHDGKSQLGFGGFIVASKLTTAGFTWVGLKTAAPFFGMAVGSFINETTEELTKSPEWKAYWDSYSEKGSAAAAVERDLAAKRLYERTVADGDWWKQKSPGITSMIASAIAAQVTMSLAVKAPAMIYQATGSGSSRSCFANALRSYLRFMSDAKPGFAKKQALSAANLGLFTLYSSLLRGHVNNAWEHLSLDQSISQSQKNAQTAMTNYLAAPPDKDKKDALANEVLASIDWETEDYDKYRMTRLKDAGEIMTSHSADFKDYHQRVDKIPDFYNWFTHGFDEQSLKDIKKKFYDDQTDDDKMNKDISKYLHFFFCGPSVEGSLQSAKDLHGLPVRGLSVKNFRVVKDIDPEVCSRSPQELRKMISADQDTYQDLAKPVLKRFDILSTPIHEKMVSDYEGRVDKDIVKVLNNTDQDKRSGLPRGIMATYSQQIQDLEKLRASAKNTPLSDEIKKKIDSVKKQQASASTILKYYTTPPDKRMLPAKTNLDSVTPEDLMALITGQRSESQTMEEFYNSYILH